MLRCNAKNNGQSIVSRIRADIEYDDDEYKEMTSSLVVPDRGAAEYWLDGREHQYQ